MPTISFKVSPEEARAIKARARRERVTVSEFLRLQAATPSRPPAKVKLRKCPLTGAAVFGSEDDLPPLTVEATREMLADFP